ncbi:hypothetical protein [Thalassiella azotivora]
MEKYTTAMSASTSVLRGVDARRPVTRATSVAAALVARRHEVRAHAGTAFRPWGEVCPENAVLGGFVRIDGDVFPIPGTTVSSGPPV